MDYFVEIIKAITWPASIIWLGYIFRKEVRLLLGRLSSVKYGEVEAWTLIETAAVKKGLTSGTTVPRTNSKIIVEIFIAAESYRGVKH